MPGRMARPARARDGLVSPRLDYAPVEAGAIDDLHRLLCDPHVRRYLLDGAQMPRTWTEERVEDSRRLFQRRGVGLWLGRHRSTGELVGFCGFLEVEAVHPEPQLIYALLPHFTGQGLATEMAGVCIERARSRAGFAEVVAGVDEVNVASLRVLEKLGFTRFASHPGAFGLVLMLKLAPFSPPLPR